MTRKTRVMVTGANGMLGRHLMPKLYELNYDVYPIYSATYDLRYRGLEAIKWAKPQIVFHLAANIGGLQHNLSNPASIYYDNIMINTQLIQFAAEFGVKKFIFAGSVCGYSANVTIPTDESQFGGLPEESNKAYGMSKFAALVQLQACHEQFGMSFSYPVLANMYGPYDRGFADDSKSHVIPSLVKKFTNDDEVIVRGDGTQTRDLLYVEDAAEAMTQFIDIDNQEPVNVATGNEVSVERVCDVLGDLTGFNGCLKFDTSKPAGQLRRCYDVNRASEVLGWHASIGIKEGLRRTVEWYNENRNISFNS